MTLTGCSRCYRETVNVKDGDYCVFCNTVWIPVARVAYHPTTTETPATDVYEFAYRGREYRVLDDGQTRTIYDRAQPAAIGSIVRNGELEALLAPDGTAIADAYTGRAGTTLAARGSRTIRHQDPILYLADRYASTSSIRET